jgi:DnaJ-domain-containing protein 1
MKSGTHAISTKSILVEISLLDGSSFTGKLRVPMQGRLTDVLNDDRQFVPVEGRDGSFVALSKRAIKQVFLPAAEAAAYRGNDPYLILGVQEGASAEEVKKAYHKLCAANHPDRIRGLGLSGDYEELATQNMTRINNAYAQVLRKAAA